MEENMKNFRIPYWVWIIAAIALSSTFGTCGIWDRLFGRSGCAQSISSGSKDDTNSLLISQDGQILIATSATGKVNIMNASDGSTINTVNVNLENGMGSVGLSSNGTLLAVQDLCETLQIINTSDGKIVFERPWKYDGCGGIFRAGMGPPGGIVFLPDGKHVVYVVTTKVVDITESFIDLIVTDITTGKDTSRLTEHISDPSMQEIIIQPNGEWIALRYKDRYELRALADFSLVETAARDDGDAKWYEVSPNGQLIKSRVFPSVYSQDGSLKAKGINCPTEVFSTKTGEIVLTLSQPRITVGDQLERLSNSLGDPYCSSISIVFTADNKYVYYSYRNHILKWQLPQIQ
jgi:WD40 repeat protein